MQDQYVIVAENVQKHFKLFYDRSNSIKDILITRGRTRYETREVLKGISFSVKKGEALGLIGKNGCGKSTLLKLLTRIYYPDAGTIRTKGRISSLLELGAGFHPDMSGRENIYLNASVFGLTRKEIEAKMDAIISFSELEEFMDHPIRTYSSGMYMRLAFAVAINVEADILLIDEILAVGDISFQEKCFEKLFEIREKGTTIVIVSHSPGQIERICDRTIWLENGRIREDGIPAFVHAHYLADAEEKNSPQPAYDTGQQDPSWSEHAVRSGNRQISFTQVYLSGSDGIGKTMFQTGEDLVVTMKYQSVQEKLEGNFGIGISRQDGVYCYGTNTAIETGRPLLVKKEGIVKVVVKQNRLLAAKYILDVAVHSMDEVPYDKIHHILEFQIKSDRKKDFGVCRMENSWIHE